MVSFIIKHTYTTHKQGKKNKRIYHALNTKDKKIAMQKQKHYDLKYSKVKIYQKCLTRKNTNQFLVMDQVS